MVAAHGMASRGGGTGPALADAVDQVREGGRVAELASAVLTGLVRTLGVVLIAAGLWAILTVLLEAVELYRDPSRIDRMVTPIEQAAGLAGAPVSPARAGNAPGSGERTAGSSPAPGVRPAYFFAWLMAILLFLVIGKLADWVISRGIALASYRSGPDPAGRSVDPGSE